MDVLSYRKSSKFDSAMQELGDNLRNVLKSYSSVSLVYGEVTGVNMEELTFDVVSDDDNQMFNIPLSIIPHDSTSVIQIPEIGSNCVLGFVQGDSSLSFPIKFSKVKSVSVQFEMLEDSQKQLLTMDKDGITYTNTTDNAKLDIKVGETSIEMQDKIVKVNGGESPMIYIEKLEAKLNDFVKAFNSHTHTIPTITTQGSNSAGTVTGTASNVGVPAPSSKAKDFNQEDFQDETFTH
nr:MAG TPA: baseplate protein [Caudoviricetes sp.]